MAVEQKRGCGYRKVGGIYLVGPDKGVACGRLPLHLGVCHACGHGIKQSRGWTWIVPADLFGNEECSHSEYTHHKVCPLADLTSLPRAGLLWIGKQHYPTPSHFQHESTTLGVSKRLNAVPKGFTVGEDWVFLAHPDVIPGINEKGEQEMMPGVFQVFKPTAIEVIITDVQAEDEDFMESLEKRGLTPVVVPHDDPDHNPGGE